MTGPRAVPAPTSEAQLQTQVVELAHLFGWRVAHFRPARTAHGWRTPVGVDGAGFPDLVLCGPRVVYAELKAQRGRLAPVQSDWQAWLTAAGAETYVWRPNDWDALVDVLRPERPR